MDKKILEELKEIKQFTLVTAQLNRDLLNEIKELRRDLNDCNNR